MLQKLHFTSLKGYIKRFNYEILSIQAKIKKDYQNMQVKMGYDVS